MCEGAEFSEGTLRRSLERKRTLEREGVATAKVSDSLTKATSFLAPSEDTSGAIADWSAIAVELLEPGISSDPSKVFVTEVGKLMSALTAPPLQKPRTSFPHSFHDVEEMHSP